jgi:preprotein translocase subunit SecB
MTDNTNDGAAGAANSSQDQPSIQARVVGQYIKDLSFENPNVGKLLDGPGESPNLKLEVNVNANRVGHDLFESAIDFKAQATNKAGMIYDLELVYAGMFKIENMPKEALQPFLLINCPLLLFPFLRRLVADLTREGGFPPLLLDPIDFAGLFMRKQQQHGAAAGKPRE